jgi:hypothetical protein
MYPQFRHFPWTQFTIAALPSISQRRKTGWREVSAMVSVSSKVFIRHFGHCVVRFMAVASVSFVGMTVALSGCQAGSRL